MRITGIFSALALCACATGAQASVVYNWNSTSSGPYASATSGQIEVTDEAYRAGSMSVNFDADYFIANDGDFGLTIGGEPIPTQLGGEARDQVVNSPLLNAGMAFTRSASAGIKPRQADQITDRTFNLDLAFNDDGTLSGTFDGFGYTTNFDSEGSGDAWRVFNFNSDAYTGFDYCVAQKLNGGCSAGTGYWKLASNAADVPAPSTWALFGLATIAAFGVGFRRKQ